MRCRVGCWMPPWRQSGSWAAASRTPSSMATSMPATSCVPAASGFRIARSGPRLNRLTVFADRLAEVLTERS